MPKIDQKMNLYCKYRTIEPLLELIYGMMWLLIIFIMHWTYLICEEFISNVILLINNNHYQFGGHDYTNYIPETHYEAFIDIGRQ